MKNILSFEQLFERIQLKRIYLKDYYFISDSDNEGILYIVSKEDKIYKIEIKFIEKDLIRIFYPETEIKVDINLLKKIVYIFNKNRLGYTFSVKEVVKPKYGLKPFGLISINEEINMKSLEKIIASTKSVNAMVKKDGDLDQFTF